MTETNTAQDQEIEQLRVQLAGCGAGALGYAGDCKPGDYGYSASLGDVLNLYAEKERLRGVVEATAIQLAQDPNWAKQAKDLRRLMWPESVRDIVCPPDEQ